MHRVSFFLYQIEDIELILSKKKVGMDRIHSSCEKQYHNHIHTIKSDVTSRFKILHLCLKEQSRAEIDLLKHQFKQLQEIKNKKDSNFYGCHVTLDEENLNRLDELEVKVEELIKDEGIISKILNMTVEDITNSGFEYIIQPWIQYNNTLTGFERVMTEVFKKFDEVT